MSFASVNRIAGEPELYSADVIAYVYNVFVVAEITIRVFHVEGGVSTCTLMFSSSRYPFTFRV